MDNFIKIWRFSDAPENYQRLSDHGGDEDGIAFIPDYLEEPWWLENLWSRYTDRPQRTPVAGGTIIIWAH